MIKPTVGRIVWYRKGPTESLPTIGHQPLAAIVVGVWGDSMVNLAVLDANGYRHSRTSVPLIQDGETAPGGAYCEWMPYQIAQATKS